MTALNTPYGGSLVDLRIPAERKDALLREAKTLPQITLGDRALCDLELLATGAFSPLRTFMGSKDYQSVCRSMRLTNGTLWPIPITLPVEGDKVKPGSAVALTSNAGATLAIM